VIGVLVSGLGTNLQAIVDAGLPVAGVISSKEGAPALDRAERAGIPHAVFQLDDFPDREARDAAMADWLVERGVTVVALAGFMWLLRAPFFERFPRVINTHPALLPAFPGAQPVEDALAYGVRWTGATVHFVEAGGVDSGEIILQEPVAVADDDTVETLRERIKAVEHRLLPEACRLALAGKLQLAEGSRRVLITQ
jgi:phosphoribosylglycinamide formyltransferase-1